MTPNPAARALAEAMRDRVQNVEASPHLVAGARHRAQRQRREAIVVTFAAASVIAIVGVAVAVSTIPDRPSQPAATTSPPAVSASPSVAAGPHPRYAPATLPRGFRTTPFVQESAPRPPADGSLVWVERLNYGRDFHPVNGPKTVISVTTTSGDVQPITVGMYGDTEPTARQLVVGSRVVIHVRNMLAERGLDVYEWTEAPGINIFVTASGDVTDAEVREFIQVLRRVQ